MALTGHLSDLSLSELIEFFCNQRKTGRLKVLYPQGAGYFYLQSGSVIDARIGVLHGIDAVFYALTLPNATFEFSVEAQPGNRTINQPSKADFHRRGGGRGAGECGGDWCSRRLVQDEENGRCHY